ncbi:hypothetical protein [Thermoproteus uzoniensis]|uniref:hypothetical protein n=1 Tax=Thermoproteus uzoniensis TaxID=184117 RepID=UPI000A7088F8|nr:hypothetical protein [Thermoproteus uzoniensis]
MSSARDLAELIRAYRELKRSIEPVLRPIEELRAVLVEPVAGPVRGELKKTLGAVLYNWVTDLGSAKELKGGDLEELYKKIKGHFK